MYPCVCLAVDTCSLISGISPLHAPEQNLNADGGIQRKQQQADIGDVADQAVFVNCSRCCGRVMRTKTGNKKLSARHITWHGPAQDYDDYLPRR